MSMVSTDSRAPAILASTIALIIIASVVVFARLYSRVWLQRTWNIDDSLVAFSWTLAATTTVLNCAQTRYGLGRHQINISLNSFMMQQKLAYINLLLYTIVLCTTKLSICFLYFRIFQVDKTTSWLIRSCISFVIIYSIIFETVSIFQCTPIHAFWNIPARAHGKCIDTMPYFYASAVCNIISDIWLMAIVGPKIAALQIRKGPKMVLLVIVSLGWLVVAASVLRIVRISAILTAEDKAWVSYDINIWSGVEVDVGIICASAPATKPLLAKLVPQFVRSRSSRNTEQRYYSKDANHHAYQEGLSDSYPLSEPGNVRSDTNFSHSSFIKG